MTAIAVLNSIQTLLVDLMPNQGSSITACVCLPFPITREFR